MMRELEVAAFAADLGTDQQLRAVGLRKVSRIAIARGHRQIFVEGGNWSCRERRQNFLQSKHHRFVRA